ncbi:hypothetical protein A6J66_001000 [Yersinia enterocolitica]|nr:hypothetical protein A6J66_001000 [Yersinia enterocolitica]
MCKNALQATPVLALHVYINFKLNYDVGFAVPIKPFNKNTPDSPVNKGLKLINTGQFKEYFKWYNHR